MQIRQLIISILMCIHVQAQISIVSVQAKHYESMWSTLTDVLFETYKAHVGSREELVVLLNNKPEFNDIKNTQEFYTNNNGVFMVMLDGDRVIGLGGIQKLDERTCELRRMYLLQQYHGRGLGQLLATTLLEKAKNLGYSTVRLIMLDPVKQAAAYGLYKKLGFYQIEKYRESLGSFYMEKQLDNKLAVIVSAATPEQWTQLKQLRLLAAQDTPQSIGGSLQDEEAVSDEFYKNVLASVSKNGPWWFFAQYNGQIVGMAGARSEHPRSTDKHLAQIVSVYVLPQFRSQGIGEKLVSTVLDHLEKSDYIKHAMLWVAHTEHKAIKLYLKLGFVICGKLQCWRIINGKQYDMYLMEKPINQK